MKKEIEKHMPVGSDDLLTIFGKRCNDLLCRLGATGVSARDIELLAREVMDAALNVRSQMERPRRSIQRLVLDCGVTLYHGDCLEILPEIEADAVVTDPPYGYNYESNYVAATTTAAWMRKPIMGDSDTSLRDSVLAWADGKPWAAFGAWRMPKPENVRGVLVWDKGPASGMGDLTFPWKGSWEEIYIGGKGWSGFRDEGVIKGHWVVTRASMGRVHPNEKPVSLMGHLLGKLPEGATVLDPFMGSGSTIIAAIRTGRKAIGIEKDPEHFKNAVERIKRELAQGDLFNGQNTI